MWESGPEKILSTMSELEVPMLSMNLIDVSGGREGAGGRRRREGKLGKLVATHMMNNSSNIAGACETVCLGSMNKESLRFLELMGCVLFVAYGIIGQSTLHFGHEYMWHVYEYMWYKYMCVPEI